MLNSTITHKIDLTRAQTNINRGLQRFYMRGSGSVEVFRNSVLVGFVNDQNKILNTSGLGVYTFTVSGSPELFCVATDDPIAFDNENKRALARFRDTLPAPIVVTETLVDLTPIIGPLAFINQPQTSNFIFYDPATQVFKCSTDTNYYYPFDIILAFTGSLPITGNNEATYEIDLLRPDGVTLIFGSEKTRTNSANANFTFLRLFNEQTFLFEGGADPFQTDGFKIGIKRQGAGENLTITATDVRFSRY